MTPNQYQAIINRYIKEHNIILAGYYKTTHGSAALSERKIWIPKPVNECTFYICLHEIGHIVAGNTDDDSNWLCEYEATKYGLEEARKLKIKYSVELTECIKNYLRYTLCVAVTKEQIPIDNIPCKVFRLAGINKSYWMKKAREGKRLVRAGETVNEFYKFRAYKVKWK